MLENILNKDNLHYKILDTNVAMAAPDAPAMFPPRTEGKTNVIIYSMTTLYELDKLKNDRSQDTRKQAIAAQRWVDTLGRKDGPSSDYTRGVDLGNGSYFVVWRDEDFEAVEADTKGLRHDNDGSILRLAKKLMKEGKDVEVISNDYGLRVMGNMYQIPCSPWFDITPIESIDQCYKGWRQVPVDTALLEEFRKNKFMRLTPQMIGIEDPVPNEFFIMHDNKNPNVLLESKYQKGVLKPLDHYYSNKGAIYAMNFAQKCLMDASYDPEISLVIAIGTAGTGKTLLELESGLRQTVPGQFEGFTNRLMIRKQEPFEGLVVWRSVIGLAPDEKLGFFPGDADEKLSLYYMPIRDQLEFILDTYKKPRDEREAFEKHIEFAPIDTVRGRTIRNRFVIFEDTQNMDYHKMAGLMSRNGEGTKVAVNGDLSPEQLDANMSYSDNGLVILNESMKMDEHTATVYFPPEFCVRSPLAMATTKNMHDFIKSRHKRIKF